MKHTDSHGFQIALLIWCAVFSLAVPNLLNNVQVHGKFHSSPCYGFAPSLT